MRNRQHHFVVYYDEATGLFDVDYDTQDVKFHGAPIYDEVKQEWEPIGDQLDNDNSIYNRAADSLAEALRDLSLREVWNQ